MDEGKSTFSASSEKCWPKFLFTLQERLQIKKKNGKELVEPTDSERPQMREIMSIFSGEMRGGNPDSTIISLFICWSCG